MIIRIGSRSTLYQITAQIDGRTYLLPTVLAACAAGRLSVALCNTIVAFCNIASMPSRMPCRTRSGSSSFRSSRCFLEMQNHASAAAYPTWFDVSHEHPPRCRANTESRICRNTIGHRSCQTTRSSADCASSATRRGTNDKPVGRRRSGVLGLKRASEKTIAPGVSIPRRRSTGTGTPRLPTRSAAPVLLPYALPRGTRPAQTAMISDTLMFRAYEVLS